MSVALDIEKIREQARQQATALPEARVDAVRQGLSQAEAAISQPSGRMRSVRSELVARLQRFFRNSRVGGVLRILWSARFLYVMRRDIADLHREMDQQRNSDKQPVPVEGIMSASPLSGAVHRCFDQALMLDVPALPAGKALALINGCQGDKPVQAERFFSDLRFVHESETAWPLLKLAEQQKLYDGIVYVQGAEGCSSVQLIEQIDLLVDHLAPAGVFVIQGVHPDETALIERIYKTGVQAVPAAFVVPLLRERKLQINAIENQPADVLAGVPACWRITAERNHGERMQ